MPDALCLEDLCLERDVAADDVCLLAHDGELYVAWSAATLQREAVSLGRLASGGRIEVLHVEEQAFRPHLSLGPQGPVLVCARLLEHGLAPVLVAMQGSEARPLVLPGQAHHVAVAASGPGHVVAVAGPEGQLTLLQAEGSQAQPLTRIAGSAPALAARGGQTWLAWVGPAGLELGRVTDRGVADRRLVAAGRPGDPPGAPALALDSAGTAWLAWHEPLDEGILRWLRLAADGEERPLVAPRPCREAAGVDQGWEFPAVLPDEKGRVWIAGRSSNGFHLQVLTRRGWTERLDLSGEGWSNRSRSCGLALLQGAVVFGRGTPAGLALTRLALADDHAVSSARRVRRPTPAAARAGERDLPPGWPAVLFGDIHQHSVCSDGTGEAERAYLRARQVYGHELFALTDHEKLGRRCLGPVTWRYQCELADAFYRPGELVTLRAYEFTGARLPGPGHKCVYFGESVPAALPEKNVEALLEVLRQHDAIAVPHHVAWTGADLEHHDPDLQPVWEICSVHGAYEVVNERRIPPRGDVLLEGQYIRQALDAGLVFGFVGGTDAHGLRWHHGVSRVVDPLATGLTAVFAEPTRQSVLSALRGRCCYATSGARILLRLDLDGAPMGSVVFHDRGSLHLEVRGTAPIERLSVIQDGREVHAASGGLDLECTLRLQARTAHSYCYIRVQQVDGQDAWSSPVWLVS